jgi:hypothetical protein
MSQKTYNIVVSPSNAGFSAQAGFSVSGSFTDGGSIFVSRQSGTFNLKNDTKLSNPEAAWVWDEVSRNFLGGSPVNSNAGVPEEGLVPKTLWTDTTAYNPTYDGLRLSYARTKRHSSATAQYCGLPSYYPNGEVLSVKVGMPTYPGGTSATSLANNKLYVSWYGRWSWQLPTASAGGEGLEDKPFRLTSSNGFPIGHTGIVNTCGVSCVTNSDYSNRGWRPFAFPPNTWHRMEVFFDRVNNTAELFVDGRFYPVGATGTWVEYRPWGTWRYIPSWGPPSSDTTPILSPCDNLIPGFIGWDDGGYPPHNSPSGGSVDVTDICADTTFRRFEITDRSTWDRSPNPAGLTIPASGQFWSGGHVAELQRVVSMTSTTATIEIRKGAHSTLSGKHLWYINDNDIATYIGAFA